MKRQWYYRGSLKSCNYACSYCPFAKRPCRERELREDKAAFFRFVEQMGARGYGGAVLVTPYGEALIHPYYWEGLAVLSRSPAIDAIGAQTNLSFPVLSMLSVYQTYGGELKKLRLWGTFHPEMVTVEQFVQQCQLLSERNVQYCVGAVGVPEHLPAIRRLRNLLPENVYLWINKMDGLKRRYTPAEIEAFLEIDVYFGQELIRRKADVSKCAENYFVEANGALRRCNVCRLASGNLYEDSFTGAVGSEPPACTQTWCRCYLSYCNRKDETFPFFQPYPAFRIPAYPKAAFFDIDGTLIPEGKKQIQPHTARWLVQLAGHCEIYLATSLPLMHAKRKMAPVWHIVRGGVFANGGRWILPGQEEGEEPLDKIAPMESGWLTKARRVRKKYGFSLYVYQKKGCRPLDAQSGRQEGIYKVVLVFPGKNEQKLEKVQEALREDLAIPGSCKVVWEGRHMQVTRKGTGKLEGILAICAAMGYRKEEVAVFGNSENDREMLAYFPWSVWAQDADGYRRTPFSVL